METNLEKAGQGTVSHFRSLGILGVRIGKP